MKRIVFIVWMMVSFAAWSLAHNSKSVSRMKNLGCPDVIFVFGGTNDSWADRSLFE